MKVGDKVYHKKRPGIATIVRVDVQHSYDTIYKKTKTRTLYTANYPDGESFTFYGFNIGKTVFKHESVQQLSLFDELEG